MLPGMALHKDDAVVLRRLDYAETSQVLAFLGRGSGQVRLIAKGIKRGTKKAFATGIDLLERGHLVFTHTEGHGGLGTLTEWKQTEAFLGLRAKLRHLYAGQYAAEITAQLTEEGDPHPELFDGLVTLLRTLSTDTDPLVAVIRFQLVLLTAVGLLPMFDACAACQRTTSARALLHFSAEQGGLVCHDCEPSVVEKRRITAPLAVALTQRNVPTALAAEAFSLLDYAISYAMGRPSRLGPYVVGQL